MDFEWIWHCALKMCIFVQCSFLFNMKRIYSDYETTKQDLCQQPMWQFWHAAYDKANQPRWRWILNEIELFWIWMTPKKKHKTALYSQWYGRTAKRRRLTHPRGDGERIHCSIVEAFSLMDSYQSDKNVLNVWNIDRILLFIDFSVIFGVVVLLLLVILLRFILVLLPLLLFTPSFPSLAFCFPPFQLFDSPVPPFHPRLVISPSFPLFDLPVPPLHLRPVISPSLIFDVIRLLEDVDFPIWFCLISALLPSRPSPPRFLWFFDILIILIDFNSINLKIVHDHLRRHHQDTAIRGKTQCSMLICYEIRKCHTYTTKKPDLIAINDINPVRSTHEKWHITWCLQFNVIHHINWMTNGKSHFYSNSTDQLALFESPSKRVAMNSCERSTLNCCECVDKIYLCRFA